MLGKDFKFEKAKKSAKSGFYSSALRNFYLVYDDEIELDEAIENIVNSTAETAGKAYISFFAEEAFAGEKVYTSASRLNDIFFGRNPNFARSGSSELGSVEIDSLLKNMEEKTRHLFRVPASSLAGRAAGEIAFSLKDFLSGKISASELAEDLGRKSASSIAGTCGRSMGATVGKMMLSKIGSAFGALAGSFIGSTIVTMLYDSVVGDLKAAEEAKAQLELVRRRYEKIHALYQAYQERLEQGFRQFMDVLRTEINCALSEIERASEAGDIVAFENGANKLADRLNCKLTHTNFESFKKAMRRG